MDYLRSLFEGVGFAKVETFIASGNVIFDSKTRNTKTLEAKIEKHLKGQLGYAVTTFIRATSELAQIANHDPFGKAELNTAGNSLYVGFLAAEPSKEAVKKVSSLAGPTNDFAVHGRELYWLIRTSFSESVVSGALLEKTLGMPATFRNVNTVRRIAAKYS
jgi:uncharacterized protein (DUF1697 family)